MGSAQKGKALFWFVVVSSPQHGENTAFFPVFPLAGATDNAFCIPKANPQTFRKAGATDKAFSRLSLWRFKEKSINHFYNTAKGKRLSLHHAVKPIKRLTIQLAAKTGERLSAGRLLILAVS